MGNLAEASLTGEAIKYAETWRRFRRRFIISAVTSALIIVLDVFIIIPQNRKNFVSLFAALGAESLLTILLIVWIFAFRCPRCEAAFFFPFPPNRKMGPQCVHCGLPMGSPSNPLEEPKNSN